MENEDFKKQIEELFRLFKKVIEKFPPDEVPGIDKSQIEQLKMHLEHYEEFKDQFSFEMSGMVDNEMARHFISMLIKRLREQLGEEADEVESSPIVEVEKKEMAYESLQTGENYQSLLDSIDSQLRNPDISEEEMDKLLDKRQKLIKNNK
ncbi:MAG: hypothetical protein ACI358_09665 [Candidatus Limimorpha sp.]